MRYILPFNFITPMVRPKTVNQCSVHALQNVLAAEYSALFKKYKSASWFKFVQEVPCKCIRIKQELLKEDQSTCTNNDYNNLK